MAEENEGQEKTLDPTPQRIARAREQGDIAKSTDVSVAAGYLGLLLALTLWAGHIGQGVGETLMAFLGAPELLADQLLAPGGAALTFYFVLNILNAASPLILAPAALVLLSLVAQRAIIFAPTKIEPKLSRLNPISNAAQKFGVGGLVEFAKSAVKLFTITIVLMVIFLNNHDGIAHFMAYDARALPALLLDEATMLLITALVISGAIAALDVLWQQHQHHKKLMMSHQDMREESKQSEGDPHVKRARRERGREIAMGRMMEDVPDADVVIVNPTHYAVALKWTRTPGSAPVCVAKGMDEIAKRIRECAEEHNVPIHSDPPTARALHATVEIGEEIRVEHFQAVAVAIRFAETVRRMARERGMRRDR